MRAATEAGHVPSDAKGPAQNRYPYSDHRQFAEINSTVAESRPLFHTGLY